MVQTINVHKHFVGTLEGKQLSVRFSGKWDNNVETDLKDVGPQIVHSIQLAQEGDQIVNSNECDNEHSSSLEGCEFLTGSADRGVSRTLHHWSKYAACFLRALHYRDTVNR
jgi:hypothetical protein